MGRNGAAEMTLGRNGAVTKWRWDDMALGRNGAMSKWRRDEMALGRNGAGQNGAIRNDVKSGGGSCAHFFKNYNNLNPSTVS